MERVIDDCFLLIPEALTVAQRKDDAQPCRLHLLGQGLLMEGCQHEAVLKPDHHQQVGVVVDIFMKVDLVEGVHLVEAPGMGGSPFESQG